MEVALIEASRKGFATTLVTLIEKDPGILDEGSLNLLHICASRGHLACTNELLVRKPELAMELDSRKRLPLHLAFAEGHTEIVKELLGAYKNANSDRDQYGRIPIYYAVMREQVNVMRELINTAGVGVLKLDGGEGSVLHLCVELKQFQVLTVLVDEYVRDNDELLNLKDGESGNTILHLAVMRKQYETVKYLLTFPKVKARADLANRMGYTALKILEDWPEDNKSSEIRKMLMGDGAETSDKSSLYMWYKKIIGWIGNLRYEGDWVEETRGPLMVVATVITTMTFQPSIAPPGGVLSLQDSESKTINNAGLAGTAVLAQTLPIIYLEFTIFNTIAFIASLSVVFLLISGFPLKSKVIMWILTFAMFTSLTFTAFSYLYAILLVLPTAYFTPLHVLDWKNWRINFFPVVFYCWVGLVVLVLWVHFIRILALQVMKRQGIIRILDLLKARFSSSPNRDEPRNGIQPTASSV